jgi:hypothetical protein
MDINEILKSLKTYEKNEFKSSFLSSTINFFDNLKNKYITKIDENEYMLAGIRIYLLYNDYYFYLTTKYDKVGNC